MCKVLTVTLNPAIDRRYVADKVEVGKVIRVKDPMESAGGKGVNVSRVLTTLGLDNTATGVYGGATGDFLLSELNSESIKNDFFKIEAETRTCINIFGEENRKTTELLESGGEISKQEVSGFINHFNKLVEGMDVVVMGGSSIAGFPKDIYGYLIKQCKTKGIKTVLDASGDYLRYGIKELPFMVKPNADEIAQLTGIDAGNRQQIIDAAKAYVKKGIKQFVISLGAEGSILVKGNLVYRAIPPEIEVANTVGCGDSMVAALVYAELKGMDDEEKLKFATAVSASNAMSEKIAFVNVKDIPSLQRAVKIEML